MPRKNGTSRISTIFDGYPYDVICFGTKLWSPSEWPHLPPKQTLDTADDRGAQNGLTFRQKGQSVSHQQCQIGAGISTSH